MSVKWCRGGQARAQLFCRETALLSELCTWTSRSREAQTRLGVVTCCPWAEPQLFSTHLRSHTLSVPSVPLSSLLSAGTQTPLLSVAVSSSSSERAECRTQPVSRQCFELPFACRSQLPSMVHIFPLVPSNPECYSVPFPLAHDVYCLLLFIGIFVSEANPKYVSVKPVPPSHCKYLLHKSLKYL